MTSWDGPSSSKAAPSDLPPWVGQLTASLSDVLTQQLASILKPAEPLDPPLKKAKASGGGPSPPSDTSSLPPADNDDDDFDRRFGHLIGLDVNDEPPLDGASDGDHLRGSHRILGDSSDEDSVDDDLVQVLNQVPNWDTGSSIRNFISNNIDRPLPDDMIKQLNEDYVPSETMQEYFSPPKMPPRLFKAISHLKSKGALRTEKTLFNAQSELFVVAKPLLAALIELKPLGSSVSKARELMSVSLHGMYSVSLRISKARRENVRFLFKEALSEVLYSYEPTHSSLYGGDSFSSQVEKAAKEAKIDLSWSASKTKGSGRPPFRRYGSQPQGFQYSGGARKYFSRQPRGRTSTPGARRNTYTPKSGSQKPKSGSDSRDRE